MNHQRLISADSEVARAMMPEYHIGTLDKRSLEVLNNTITLIEPRGVFLQPGKWRKMTLTEKTSISWNTKIFKFQLEQETQTLGLPIGQHLLVKVQDPDLSTKIIRSYTPISGPETQGQVELLVKIYFATDTAPGGKMTSALDELALGSQVECMGPTGQFEYLGNGRVMVKGRERTVRSFKMICGGTGITPMLQVLRAIMSDPHGPTTCCVVTSNTREEDILCLSELDGLVQADRRKCTVVHTLTKGSISWTGCRGRISAGLLQDFAGPADDSMALVCGPPAMERSARRILVDQGWLESDLHFF